MVHQDNGLMVGEDESVEDGLLDDTGRGCDVRLEINGKEVDLDGAARKDLEDDVDDPEDDDDDDGLPIDRGWAWVISMATFVIQLLKVGYQRSMGLLFIEFLRVYQTNTTVTTLISGVSAGVFGFSVFISMQVLVGWIPVRYIIMIGGTIASIAIIGSAFATNIVQLILLQGALAGCGNSMMAGPAYVLISKYFKKRRGLGTSLASSGISVGSVAFPILMRYLLDEYGLQGTLLIVGAIQLNIVTMACLMRPLESFKRSKIKRDVLLNNAKLVKSKELETYPALDTRRKSKSCEEIQPYMTQFQLTPSSTANIHQRSKSQCSLAHSQSELYNFKGVLMVTDEVNKDQTTGCTNPLKNIDFSVLKNPYFSLIGTTSFLGIIGILFVNYYPVLMYEQGSSKQDAAIFLSIAGGIDFFARLGAGYISDFGCIKRTYICVISLIITGINCHMVRIYTTYGLQLMGTILFGLFGGIFTSFLVLLIPDFLGVEKMAKALGFNFIILGSALSIYNPLVGALKDFTGSYVAAYHFMGTLLILAAVLLLMEPLFGKCVEKQEQKEKDVQL
ncbi:hypothetical protein LOTGIDRAFT_231274 [Lottia gigantea]|uniref:Major facilitator superfamily (MFS) profile domain-containing protein n=1 Tax=Lottia gigantea TaxID=225164 RepID=V4A4Y9_LOTGI|nr:hypothetical protein LOTGIDRAFT_231274 [Lottia gigantea]ESO98953.1 hypothetical protein LOTGIDRAFT_231274 [Lottia gigantea]